MRRLISILVLISIALPFSIFSHGDDRAGFRPVTLKIGFRHAAVQTMLRKKRSFDFRFSSFAPTATVGGAQGVPIFLLPHDSTRSLGVKVSLDSKVDSRYRIPPVDLSSVPNKQKILASSAAFFERNSHGKNVLIRFMKELGSVAAGEIARISKGQGMITEVDFRRLPPKDSIGAGFFDAPNQPYPTLETLGLGRNLSGHPYLFHSKEDTIQITKTGLMLLGNGKPSTLRLRFLNLAEVYAPSSSRRGRYKKVKNLNLETLHISDSALLSMAHLADYLEKFNVSLASIKKLKIEIDSTRFFKAMLRALGWEDGSYDFLTGSSRFSSLKQLEIIEPDLEFVEGAEAHVPDLLKAIGLGAPGGTPSVGLQRGLDSAHFKAFQKGLKFLKVNGIVLLDR